MRVFTDILIAVILASLLVLVCGAVANADPTTDYYELRDGDCFTEVEELHDILVHEYGEQMVDAAGGWSYWKNPVTGTWSLLVYNLDEVCLADSGVDAPPIRNS